MELIKLHNHGIHSNQNKEFVCYEYILKESTTRTMMRSMNKK